MPSHTLSGRIGKVVASRSYCCMHDRFPEATLIYTMHEGAQGVLPMRVGGATNQFDLPSLTPLQLGVPHLAVLVDYCKLLTIDPTLCSTRFFTGRFLAIEDYLYLSSSVFSYFILDVSTGRWRQNSSLSFTFYYY